MTAPDASGWLPHAIGYIADWLGFQMRISDLPGSVLAVAHHGQLTYERAYGVAERVADRNDPVADARASLAKEMYG